MQRKSGLLLFLTSCIPGCGQMYQGYMKRGVSLLGAGCLLIALSALLGIGELAAVLPVVWLYAFFDSYNLRNRLDYQWNELPEDEFLFGLGELTGDKFSRMCAERHNVIGGLLIAVGVYSLYRTVLGGILRRLAENYDLWWLYDLAIYQLPRILATIAIIVLGAWFIRGPRKTAPEEEYRDFTPPAAGAAPTYPPRGDSYAPPRYSDFVPQPSSDFAPPVVDKNPAANGGISPEDETDRQETV